MKKIWLIPLFLLIYLCLIAEPFTLFFTNDSHGYYLPNKYKTGNGSIELGGYESLYHLISAQRDTIKSSLWLDAGDQQTGTVFSSMRYKKAVGGAVVEAFSKMGLDAATFGNHEFDQSYANVKQLTKIARYPYISTNLVDKKSKKPITDTPYKIFKKGNLRIGVMGLTLTELYEKVKTENVETIEILPYKQAIDQYIDELDKQTDCIILLTHIGIDADSLLATQLDSRIDVIVGGHSHAITEKPMLVNGIYIVQTGAQLAYLGRLDLDIVNDRIANSIADEYCLLPIEVTKSDKKTDFSTFFDTITAKIDMDMNKVIGYTEVDWTPDKYKETAVSQWQAEALLAEYKDKYHPEIAMINCGGIRKAIPAGPITVKDMTEMLPFINYIVIFSCKGSDFGAFYALNKKNRLEKPYDIIQTTRSEAQWMVGAETITNPDGSIDMAVGGSTLDPNKIYRIVSHDYVVGQWEKYLGFKPFDVIQTNDTITDVMIKQVEKQLGKKKL